ncbi:MAG: thiamine phosphate synthase [Rhizobiaceae bacterium]|jgi:thiamine-phosphate pyrophosphorylase|nr:thiamine phosphate synthase [Rhizobiaceae bacterium]
MSLPSRLDRFYPIFDHTDWLERLLPLGIKLVQLRAKDLPENETRSQIRRAKQLCDDNGTQLIVNDYWELAIDEGCDFIHLGQEDLEDADLETIRKHGLKLGVSTHDPDELDRALAVNPDYVALGPIYPTILKKMKWHQQGVEKLTEWKSQIGNVPLVGIGGMSVERAPGVFAAGADIVSVVTDITLNDDPEKRVKEWISVTRP